MFSSSIPVERNKKMEQGLFGRPFSSPLLSNQWDSVSYLGPHCSGRNVLRNKGATQIVGLSLDVFVQQKGVSQEDSPSIPFHPFASSSFSQTVDKDVQCFGKKSVAQHLVQRRSHRHWEGGLSFRGPHNKDT